jgi:hypothetical protein
MFNPIQKFLIVITTLFFVTGATAASETNICSELSRYFANNHESKLPNPARKPTKAEDRLIKKSNIELLQSNDYSNGVSVVDANNDGREDVFVWSIQGTGRFVNAEIFELPSRKGIAANLLEKNASLELGHLVDPRFVRHQGVNYLVYTTTGDTDGTILSRLVKVATDKYIEQHVCVMRTMLRPETNCRHPACKALKERIADKEMNRQFVKVEWPH